MTLQTMCFIFGALLLAVGILGGGFEVKEIKVSNVTTAGRIAAAIVGAVFVFLGFWQPGSLSLPLLTSAPQSSSAPAQPSAAPAAAVQMSEREQDKDRFGGDFTYFHVEAARIEACEDACRNDAKCLAWTYVKPGVHGPQAACALKNVVPAISNNACCVSGTKVVRR